MYVKVNDWNAEKVQKCNCERVLGAGELPFSWTSSSLILLHNWKGSWQESSKCMYKGERVLGKRQRDVAIADMYF